MTEEVHGPETDAAVAKARKSTERKPRRRVESLDDAVEALEQGEPEKAAESAPKPAEAALAEEKAEIPEVTPETARGTVYASALVAHNEARRNSQSVRAVQEALAEGDWRVSADPAGYWGEYTQRAAIAATGQADPVEAARRLGFHVL